MATLEAFHDPSKNCPCHNQAEMLSVLHGQWQVGFSSSEVIITTDSQKGGGRKGLLISGKTWNTEKIKTNPWKIVTKLHK